MGFNSGFKGLRAAVRVDDIGSLGNWLMLPGKFVQLPYFLAVYFVICEGA